MAPPHLNLDSPVNDLDHAPSPAINIQNTDRFPASPWNEYDTNWKFPSAPDIDAPNSNPYTPSYNGSFNSWGSRSVSWGGRERSDPVNMYEDTDIFMDDSSSSRPQREEEYNPQNYDGDIVGDLDDIPPTSFGGGGGGGSGGGPQLSFTPAIDTFVAPQAHSPAFSGASASSPGSDLDINNPSRTRSRASSVSSNPRPNPSTSPPAGINRTFGATLSFDSPGAPSFSVATHPPSSPSMKPNSPPALVIPGEDGGLAPPQNPHAPGLSSQGPAAGLSAPGVSIHIVPSTPVGGLEVESHGTENHGRDAPFQQLMDQSADGQQSSQGAYNVQGTVRLNDLACPDRRFSGVPSSESSHHERRSWGQTTSTPAPGSHPPTPQYHARNDSNPFQSHSRSGSSTHGSPPTFSPRPQMEFSGRMDFGHVSQAATSVAFDHRSPALSSGASSLHNSPLQGTHLDLSPSPRPVHDEFLLPDSDPGVSRRRAASERGRRWDINSSLGYSDGIGSLSLTGMGPTRGQGTVDPNDVLAPPDSAGSGQEAFGHAQYAHHPFENPHLLPRTAAAGGFAQSSSSDDFLSPGSVNLRRANSDSGHFPLHRRGVKSEDLRVPASQDLFAGYRGVGASNLLAPPGLGLLNVSSVGKRRGHDRHSSLGSHGHASVRSSPYPSPKASPARPSHGLPDVGSMTVFDTFGATGAGPDVSQLNTTNPPRRLVTTKATHDASSARRKNEPGFMCPVPGCGSTFTRSFNLKGNLNGRKGRTNVSDFFFFFSSFRPFALA